MFRVSNFLIALSCKCFESAGFEHSFLFDSTKNRSESKHDIRQTNTQTVKQQQTFILQGTPCRLFPFTAGNRWTTAVLSTSAIGLWPLSKISNPHTNHRVRDLWGALTFRNKVNVFFEIKIKYTKNPNKEEQTKSQEEDTNEERKHTIKRKWLK